MSTGTESAGTQPAAEGADPELVEEIDAIEAGLAECGVCPEGGPYQTHTEPGEGADGGPYQPHQPAGGDGTEGGPYQTHSGEPAVAQQ